MDKQRLIFLLLFIMSVTARAEHAKNFEQAKKTANLIWHEHRKTFYCNCAYDKHGFIDFKQCGYRSKDRRSSKWISWEHVVPVSWYGKKLSCWKQPLCITKNGKKFKGRNCCKKISPLFKKMEADLHNLVPAIKEVNLGRENFRFGEFHLDSNASQYYFNHCPLILDERYQMVEPRDEIKGMVARIAMYIAEKYGIDLGNRQRSLLADWNNRFPVSPWEKQWNHEIATIQGDSNYYIEPQGNSE